jgi:hypothetical protein
MGFKGWFGEKPEPEPAAKQEPDKGSILLSKKDYDILIEILSKVSRAALEDQKSLYRLERKLESIESNVLSTWILLTGAQFKDMDDDEIEDFVDKVEETRVRFNDVLLRLKGYN